jgi:hypothetical protein
MGRGREKVKGGVRGGRGADGEKGDEVGRSGYTTHRSQSPVSRRRLRTASSVSASVDIV